MHFSNYFHYHPMTRTYEPIRAIRVPVHSWALMDVAMNSSLAHSLQRAR
jgi:hypothetical protein